MIGLLASVFLALVLLAAGIGALLAQARGKPIGQAVASVLAQTVAPALLSASFVAAVLALMGKLFSIDIEEFEPASEERFEELFTDLVDDVRRGRVSRLAVFVDELDRCRPSEVVAVLETIRTFLDIRGCVFVVAADQQVLERALTQAARHAFPEDSERPYYSSGAEYLDKIFQHQFSIPPLYPQRLTEFALSLVRESPGVWTRADDLPSLVSVLVPSHVTSPRRVKVLLNGFVTLYHIVRARHEADPATTPNPDARLLELAKLSTLRLEFPRFYRDVERHPRLVTDLTAYVLNGGWPPGLKEQASSYGTEELVQALWRAQTAN